MNRAGPHPNIIFHRPVYQPYYILLYRPRHLVLYPIFQLPLHVPFFLFHLDFALCVGQSDLSVGLRVSARTVFMVFPFLVLSLFVGFMGLSFLG